MSVEDTVAAVVGKPKENRLLSVSAGRPAYPTRANAAFGVSPGDWRALVDAVWPSAQTTEAVELALSYCRARKLDPFKRPVHIVPVWDSKKNGYVETIWPGIGELRTTASRTGQWAGVDDAEFGPEITRTFKGVVKKGTDPIEKTVTFPAWAQVTVYKIIQGQRVAWKGPKVRWEETYATMGRSDVPNEMWESRPYGQLEKCAEAAALRRAFPEEIGNEYIPEEAGRSRGPSIDINPLPEGATRTDTLLGRLQEGQTLAASNRELERVMEEEHGIVVAPVQVAEDLHPPQDMSRDQMVDAFRALVKAHFPGQATGSEAVTDALQGAFGVGSYVKVVGMAEKDPAGFATGLEALRRNLEGLAKMRAEADREPGTGPGEEEL